ncbi:uncharacterized protein LOC103696146 [Phoenix dactylifera]|uniref:Uncharacterized protein LOC103696146 n=1 Tax=Phoenix dactylifera TaxID=42345 RepID=A0A8B7BFZ5_PHODC|nr:uncharacterized protein LOC103696146 [Phoenix dactylifera]
MDRGSKKRGREEAVAVVLAATEEEKEVVVGGVAAEITMRKGKRQEISAPSASRDVIFEAGDIFEISDVYRPPGLFEFPWQKEEDGGLLTAAAESDVRDLRDVFFSSLVDGCSATIGFPGDRLSPPPGPIAFPGDDDDESWPSEGDDDGVDCIWSIVLRQPLTAVCCKRSSP